MDSEDAGSVIGCLLVIGLILLKGAVVAVIAYIVLHFAFKYW